MITAFLSSKVSHGFQKAGGVCGIAVPCHDIICDRRGGHASRRISLHALEVAHQAPSCCCGHVE
jgi:hypothetical protein